ncbi:ParB/RepB/Spo0J family partition protein [Intestinimonas butyriciproducens]|uniref:ParB/RepB/Spo0J family partition protein n=1 Tax=Intestinimonas butyriciproducens TaxID=1297617 RepID=UPI0034A4C9BE
MKKSINDRCPLQVECERKKCDFIRKELECPYYSANAREGYYIYDQEAIRDRRDREAMDEALLASLGDDDDDSHDGLVYIPVEDLYPHPDNPRKDLGDLTELADSIKANGVLQNLTVVPRTVTGEITGETWQKGYTVVIGHRRLAASKLAGLKEAPCVITDMDLRSQVQTMLMENIQRSDLTIYEQAQGFQMMLDMGDTVEDIAEKSGFSATTVRRRVKLLELDKDKFKKSEERGVSLFEYMELDKLKSPERKNEMLDYIGTENFKYKLKQAIDAEAAEERRAKWVELLSTFATQVDSRTGYRTVKSDYVNSKVEMERPDDADTVEYFFCIEKWGYIALMVKDEPTAATPEDEAKKHEEQLKQERKNAAEKALAAATARAYELRADFVATVSATAIKKCLADIVALWAYAEYWDDTGWLTEEEIAQATGVESPTEEDEDGDDDAEFTLQAVTDAIGKTPEKALLRMIYARLGDCKSEGYFRSYWNSYTMKHDENEKLDRIYALLVKLGYEMSDDEKALQDGTHELFGEATDE